MAVAVRRPRRIIELFHLCNFTHVPVQLRSTSKPLFIIHVQFPSIDICACSSIFFCHFPFRFYSIRIKINLFYIALGADDSVCRSRSISRFRCVFKLKTYTCSQFLFLPQYFECFVAFYFMNYINSLQLCPKWPFCCCWKSNVTSFMQKPEQVNHYIKFVCNCSRN